MNDYNSVNPAKAYLDGMLWAAFGILKEAEIDHLVLTDAEKERLKSRWKQYLDNYTQGLKDELRKEGRMVEMP